MVSTLYRLIAEQTSATVNKAAIAQSLGTKATTVTSYLSLLNKVYLTTELPGWTAGISVKTAHRPKYHVADTGLAATAVGMDAQGLAASGLAGGFLESFVLAELTKQRSLVDEPLTFAHFRDRSDVEVDIIIERPNRHVIAIEVKSATQINTADAKGLKFVRDRIGEKFSVGIVLYTGTLTVNLSDRIWAMPVSALWDSAVK